MTTKEAQGLTSILEAIEDGIYIINQDYIVEFMNKAMVDVFGEGTGDKCYRLVNGRDEICAWCRAPEIFEDMTGKTLRWELLNPTVGKTFDLTEVPLRNADGTVSKLSIYRDITRLKKREERLRASEEDYKRLFEHVGSGVYISSREGKFLNANQALLDMLGYDSKEEFLEIDITKDLYVKPEDRRRFQEMIERDGQVIDYEVDFKRKKGNALSVLLTALVRYDSQGRVLGYEGIMVDQSQRKQMEEELKEAHDFLDQTIRSSPNAIIASDLKGNIIIWNRAAGEMLGYKAEEVIGKMNVRKIYPERMANQVMRMLRSHGYGGLGRLRSYPMVYLRKDGEIVEGNLSAAIIYDTKGNEVATVGITVDLEERLEMERKLRQTQEQLLQSEKLAAMGRLTSQVAHELNNPLFGIMNTLELLKTEIPPQSKRRRILEMALSETVRLTDLLRKMLSFSKPDQEERQPTDIYSILDEILLLYEKQLRENSIRVNAYIAEGTGIVHASKNQLRQVFLNLISNARDAMSEGGTLTVRTRVNQENIFIEISDTGIGIAEENLNKIFDTFFTTKDSIKGVGLGLSVCYGFIQDHGGDIKVKSKLGSGTTFTVTLPLYKEADSQAKGSQG
ncbi:MAG: PAS domain S-box protein [Deltaproteobacteria bacterium]|nr:PAS domain S-box protein [Deltaproteobacteria bacterium]MBW2051855.1 PAS domain S-box protein [Deltaproteobacteria bacterium]MBW2140796.1 PAS domain S-box protein [Deltaproteobacteria bacterium]MBW2323398.1 PAS domain S-box protein [Deltaproteobacteria bacterium]